MLNFELMKAGLPPINVKVTDRERYYDCFNHYCENKEDATALTKLVEEYEVYELKRYIEIAEQSDVLRSNHPENFCAESKDKHDR